MCHYDVPCYVVSLANVRGKQGGGSQSLLAKGAVVDSLDGKREKGVVDEA
jgi:hypothetical protein